MPPKNITLGPGKIYMDGLEFASISDSTVEFSEDYLEEVNRDYIRKNVITDFATMTCYIKVNRIIILKLIGFWDIALKYCPNRRLTYLMEHGKNPRVKLKNYDRAIGMAMCMLLQQAEVQNG